MTPVLAPLGRVAHPMQVDPYRPLCQVLQGGAVTSPLRVGLGQDSHRLASGGPLILGGVTIPHDHHAVGHSDADVLLHAVTDSLLGAAALGDIGEMFPDTDPANRGRDSAQMLQRAYERVQGHGFRILNLDCVVHAERPKLSPHKTAIRQRVADILALSPDYVGLKAKTAEELGAIGAGQAIAATCVVLLEKIPS